MTTPEDLAETGLVEGLEPRTLDAVWLARASAELLEMSEEDLTIERIVEKAVEVIPNCDFGGISIRKGKQVDSPASTGPIAQQVDDAQYEVGEGPCLDAIWVDDVYVIEDVRVEARWPRWARITEDLGVRSVLSVRLATTAETLGCLNLYSATPGAFDADTVDLAQSYASLAATALASARKINQLQRALETRHRIGIAQGILMVQFGLSEAASFELLRRYSQQENIKLRDVARDVVASLGAGTRNDVAGRDGDRAVAETYNGFQDGSSKRRKSQK